MTNIKSGYGVMDVLALCGQTQSRIEKDYSRIYGELSSYSSNEIIQYAQNGMTKDLYTIQSYVKTLLESVSRIQKPPSSPAPWALDTWTELQNLVEYAAPKLLDWASWIKRLAKNYENYDMRSLVRIFNIDTQSNNAVSPVSYVLRIKKLLVELNNDLLKMKI